MQYDAIIIGARCAGAATALQLARGGKNVLVLDRNRPGTDTMSTHALMRGAVIQLERWGLLDSVIASGAPEVTRTRFSYGEETIDLPIKPSHGTRSLIAPRRYILDQILADAATEAGADIRYGCSFVNVQRDPYGHIEGVIYDSPDRRKIAYAPLVIGADGRRSTVARRVHSRVLQTAEHATNCIYAYVTGLPNTGYQWFYQEGLGTGAIPTHNNTHCVFASTSAPRLRRLLPDLGRDGALRHLLKEANPNFGEQLNSAKIVTRPVIYGGDPGFLRTSAGPGWALVGDAGYFKDPLTAHGITDAFRDAELLSQTILTGGSLYDYEATRNAWSAELFAVTNRIAALDWSLDELKLLHLRLNEIMKAEQSIIAGEERMPLAA
ncbi:MAG: NAD(P)/FAD-dependent oxidoreductase [Pseudomonadota bacterium]